MTKERVEQTIQNILERLLTGYAPQKVILFGSYAYGNPRRDSDIDLLVIKETSERFIDRWVTARRLLTDPSRRLPLQVIVLTPQELSERLDIGDQFIKEIIDRGEVLYDASFCRVKNRSTRLTGCASPKRTWEGVEHL